MRFTERLHVRYAYEYTFVVLLCGMSAIRIGVTCEGSKLSLYRNTATQHLYRYSSVAGRFVDENPALEQDDRVCPLGMYMRVSTSTTTRKLSSRVHSSAQLSTAAYSNMKA